jgi:chemotaxis protein methyltransferase CheR
VPPERPAPGNGERAPVVHGFRLSGREFEAIRRLVKEKTGISLGLHKQDLVISRLARRLRALEIPSFRDYLRYLEGPEGPDELVQMINRITTNKTDFFREKHHFDYLSQELLPRLHQAGEARGRRRLRVWSAGCSSGEEPYTLAMTLAEFFHGKPGWDLKILATDLDTSMLQKASAGEYEERLLEPVPRGLLHKHFTRQKRGGAVFYRANPGLRGLITFRKFNLMHPSYPIRVPLDFVFCRNVLIYFDAQDKLDIVTKFHAVLAPGGHLFVGHSESLMGAKELFHNVGTTIYQRI